MRLIFKDIIIVIIIIIIIIIITTTTTTALRVFLHQCQLMVFHWSLSDSNSPQVSRKFLSILADIVVWMVSTISSNFQVFHSLYQFFGDFSECITFMFQSLFSSLARSRYLSLFLLSFNFTLWSARTAKSTIQQLFLFIYFFILFYFIYSVIVDYH